MAEGKYLDQATKTFNTLCRFLDDDNWHYEKDENGLSIQCSAKGDDLPIDVKIFVEADRGTIMLLSFLPGSIPQDKRLEMSYFINVINNHLVDGCFDFDISDGEILFRQTNYFVDREIGKGLFEYMIYVSCQTVDEYNDKFVSYATGVMTSEAFLKFIISD